MWRDCDRDCDFTTPLHDECLEEKKKKISHLRRVKGNNKKKKENRENKKEASQQPSRRTRRNRNYSQQQRAMSLDTADATPGWESTKEERRYMAIINALTENGPSSLVVSIQTHNRGEFYVAVAEKRQQQTLVFSRKDAAKKSLSQGEKQQLTPEIEKKRLHKSPRGPETKRLVTQDQLSKNRMRSKTDPACVPQRKEKVVSSQENISEREMSGRLPGKGKLFFFFLGWQSSFNELLVISYHHFSFLSSSSPRSV